MNQNIALDCPKCGAREARVIRIVDHVTMESRCIGCDVLRVTGWAVS